MEEKIGTILPQAAERKGEVTREELEKIQSMLQEKTSIFIVKDLFPDIWKKEYIPHEVERGDIGAYFEDWLDGRKIPEDLGQTFQRLYAFITSKSPEEIFEFARNVYQTALEGKLFERAHGLALRYFDKSIQDEVVQKAFNFQYERMNKSKDRGDAAGYAEAFFRSKFGELCMQQATGEQLGDIFERIIYGKWAQTRENARTLFQELRVFLKNGAVEIKDRQSVRNFFHEFARETMENYLKRKDVDPRTIGVGNFFERHGLLSLDEDADLFEELTKAH
jgi:hypothetical protein